MRNDDCATVCDGVNGGFQKIALSEKYIMEEYSSKDNEEYAEQPERTADSGAAIVQKTAKPIQKIAKSGKNMGVCEEGILPGVPVQRTVSS